MKTKFNFNSQICTTREQSERLIALGLKKETADMVYKPHYINGILKNYFKPTVLEKNVLEYMLMDEAFKDYIPAWSLHRLWELGNLKHIVLDSEDEILAIYDGVIDFIESKIEEGIFNKNYLKD